MDGEEEDEHTVLISSVLILVNSTRESTANKEVPLERGPLMVRVPKNRAPPSINLDMVTQICMPTCPTSP